MELMDACIATIAIKSESQVSGAAMEAVSEDKIKNPRLSRVFDFIKKRRQGLIFHKNFSIIFSELAFFKNIKGD